MQMTTVWILLAAGFFIAEIATFGLATIWFAIGALAALPFAYINAPFWLQAAAFILVSAGTLVLLRPFITGVLKIGRERTNADRVIGKTARVIMGISNEKGEGQVILDGQVWTARSDNDQDIPVDTEVVALRIAGVKLVVKPLVKRAPQASPTENPTTSTTAPTAPDADQDSALDTQETQVASDRAEGVEM